MSVVNVISGWVVNTFYNYLHQKADEMHRCGKVSSITDGYTHWVRLYLGSFNNSEGYLQNLRALHKYWNDNTTSVSPLDAWIKDILQEFVPSDYFPIMSNKQQDLTLRNVLVTSIKQFSVDIVCTGLRDRLIENHDDPALVPFMKDAMKKALLYERERLFQAVFKSSTNAPDKPTELMKKQLVKLIEENVSLGHKSKQMTKDIKKALSGMKAKDATISRLTETICQLQKQLAEARSQPNPAMYIEPMSRAPANPPRPQPEVKSEEVERFTSIVEKVTGLGGRMPADEPLRVPMRDRDQIGRPSANWTIDREQIDEPDAEPDDEPSVEPDAEPVTQAVAQPESAPQLERGQTESILDLDISEFLNS